MSEYQLILKTMPPRVPSAALQRDRLQRTWGDVHRRAMIAVFAPAGFGKTTLLAQWRQLWLEGAIVAWLSADEQDDPSRFTMALLHAVHRASGHIAFDTLATRFAAQQHQEMEALTGLLAEIADLGTETVLVIDDAEGLPEATVQESLAYLLYNAPPNLHVVIGSRVPLPSLAWESATKGDFAVLSQEDLRLRPEESVAILGKRFGQRLSLDDCMRLHEATQGWPIGLQLAAATIEGQDDVAAAVNSLSARRGGIERYFVESLFQRLPEALTDFLTRTAALDHLNAELCTAVTGCTSAAQHLEWLMRETPIMMAGEQGWIRPHPLARDFLLSRFEQLPPAEQAGLRNRASRWFAERGDFHQAACHALAAGDEALAHSYAVRSLWSLGTQGRLAEARDWLDRIPSDFLAKDVELRLFAAWIMALSERNAEALKVGLEVMDDPTTAPELMVAALRVVGGAAAYSDRLGLIPGLISRWPEGPVRTEEPLYAVSYLNGLAFMALHAGSTDETRQHVASISAYGNAGSLRLAGALAQVMGGLSHLWDGSVHRVESALRPALVRAEGEAGRRGMIASLFAPVLAAALLESGQTEAARTLLANRLDVIERTGFPDTILLAYRTLAYIAISQGDERHALDVLDSLGALAKRRHVPRFALTCLTEQIRIHALRACHETVRGLVQQLDELVAVFRQEDFQTLLPHYQLATAIAKTYAALARRNLEDAEQQLGLADAVAGQLRRGRDAMTIKVLRAVVARQRNSPEALPLLAEAMKLAEVAGIGRLLVDTHPLAVEMSGELDALPGAARGAPEGGPATTAPAAGRDAPHGDLLTAKEGEILNLLGDGLSNKMIARILGISDETVKWHLKNLFLKLSAANRRHAVDRARLLGLISTRGSSHPAAGETPGMAFLHT